MQQIGHAEGVHERRLEPDPAAVADARGFAAQAAKSLGADPDAQETVVMLVSELVTNVVLHAGTSALVRVSDSGDFVRVKVTDGHPAAPLQRRRFGPMESTGRGMRLLEVLAVEHGTDPDDAVAPQGKTVWFTLRKTVSAADEQARLDATLALFGSLESSR